MTNEMAQPIQVGSRLQKFRKDKGLNQSDFSKRCLFTQSTLSLYEKGKLPLSDIAVERLKAGFPELNIEWLKTGIGPSETVDSTSIIASISAKYGLDPYGRALLETYLSMSPTGKAEVSRFIMKLTATVQAAEEQLQATDTPGGVAAESYSFEDFSEA